MARRRGGFASNGGFASGGSAPSTTPQRGPQNRDTANSFATAAIQPNRRRRRRRDRSGDGGGGDNPHTQDPLTADSAGESLGFEGQDNWRAGAWQYLEDAGVDREAGFGGNAIPWLDDKVQSWMDDYHGESLRDPSLTWEQYLQRMNRAAAPAPGTAPALDPILNLPVMPRDPVLNLPMPPGAGASAGGPWGSGMGRALGEQWYASTPQIRGYDSRQYRAPKRTVQF